MNHLEREYRDRVDHYLRQYSTEAVIALKQVLAMDFDDDTAFIDFVLWPGSPFEDTLPICVWPTNQENQSGLVDPCPISNIKISRFEYYDWDIEDYVEIADCLKDVVAHWLLEAWKEAGGRFFSLPCYFTARDDLMTFDFSTEQWVEGNPHIKKIS